MHFFSHPPPDSSVLTDSLFCRRIIEACFLRVKKMPGARTNPDDSVISHATLMQYLVDTPDHRFYTCSKRFA